MEWYRPLWLRADAYKALGQPDKEQADRAAATEIMNEMARSLAAYPYVDEEGNDDPDGVFSGLSVDLSQLPTLGSVRRLVAWMGGPLFVAVVFVVMVPIFFLMGLRQRREASGAWRRLFGVSLALAALQTAPVLTAYLLLWWRPWLFYGRALLSVTLMVFLFNLIRHRAYLTAVRFARAREAILLLEDAVVLGRIAQIAGGLGIAPPVTRLLRSTSSLQKNNAFVTGLAAPTMVLYDGILYRLAEDERDAIIAHELAHLANHTFWHWLFAGAACSIAVIAAAAFYPVLVALAVGMTLLTGAWLILSRRLELDSDRRAARAIGHRRAASALWKIHADQPFRGLIEFLIGAVSTHPSRDERLAAVHRDAPNDAKPEIEWDSRLLGRRRVAAWGAAGLWLSVVVACLLWGYRSPESSWPALPLVLMAAAPVALLWLGQVKAVRRRRRLLRTRSTWLTRLTWLAAALLVGSLIAYWSGLADLYLNPWANLTILVGSLLTLWTLTLLSGRNRAKKLNHQINIAIQRGDYPKALSLAEGSPTVVARDPKLRYNQALIRVVLGRREEALADLERLRRDDPRFKMTWLLLANVYTDEGEYARALELAAELSRDLPGDPTGPLVESWLLRKVGRLEEAEARARAVLRMDPKSGKAHLTLAAVAFDRGDQAGADKQLALAERLTPGSVAAALFAAEMALATNAADAADAVRKAVSAAKNNPLSFTQKTVADLGRRLDARSEAASDEIRLPVS